MKVWLICLKNPSNRSLLFACWSKSTHERDIHRSYGNASPLLKVQTLDKTAHHRSEISGSLYAAFFAIHAKHEQPLNYSLRKSLSAITTQLRN